MALKLWLVKGDVLDADSRFACHNIAHLVDQKEWIAMRDNPLNDIQIGFGS